MLVAGDVFDGNLVPERVIVQALAAMRGFAGPWVLLPGNHDAALAEGVWSRLERLGRPANIIVAAAPTPITLADGRLVVLPAPLTERHTSDDLTAWMDAAVTPSGAAASRPCARLGRRPPAARGRRGEPDRRRAGDPRPARLSGAGRLARHARDRPPHLVCRHARARPLSRQRCRQRAAGRAGRAGCPAKGGAPAHGASRLAPARARPHRGRRSQGGVGPAAGGRAPGRERAVVQLTLTGVLDLEARTALGAGARPLGWRAVPPGGPRRAAGRAERARPPEPGRIARDRRRCAASWPRWLAKAMPASARWRPWLCACSISSIGAWAQAR